MYVSSNLRYTLKDNEINKCPWSLVTALGHQQNGY